MLMGSLGVVTALLCLYWQFTGTTGPREKEEHFDRAPLFAVAMTFVYPLLVFLLGYIVGTISFILTMIPARRGNLRVLLGFAVLVIGLWLVFSKFLFLRLPSGILWPLFS